MPLNAIDVFGNLTEESLTDTSVRIIISHDYYNHADDKENTQHPFAKN